MLMGMTYFNGSHYRGAIFRKPDWFFYDGLWERNNPGTGLQKGSLTAPDGYILSTCFYVNVRLISTL
jgi:hypothetical protein